MSGADQIVKGAVWCLRSVRLPHGTQAQLEAWLAADPRPNVTAEVVKPPAEEPIEEVWFAARMSRETFRLPTLEFTRRYQPVHGDPPRPEQVPPERPPASHGEYVARRLEGW